jgi:putative NADH-flavin reductase
MRFLVLGGTGPSGIELIRKILQVYPDAGVVVYARSPQKVPEDLAQNPAVTIVKGTLEELDKVETAVEGVNVVVSALGPLMGHPPNTPIATFYGHLIDLLHKHNITRIIVLGTASFKDPNDKHSWKFAAMVSAVRTLANSAYREIVAIGEVITTKGADLDWTIVRVPVLTQANTDAVFAGYIGDPKVGTILARKAYAAFTIGEVEKREWVKKSPMISNA